ncbi:MAG: phosphodiester glycosidase family protein [Myxococcaceae bacterium]
MLGLALVLAIGASPAEPAWRPLAEGIEYATFDLGISTVGKTQATLHAVRIDPALAELKFALASRDGGTTRTAGAWAERAGLVVAINAGMFVVQDYRSNVGHLVDGTHVNQSKWVDRYKSVLAFGPKKPGMPAASILDLEGKGARAQLDEYAAVVQNLRLIKAPGVNLWKPNGRSWSEAAIASDREGRLLFLFSRAPFTMSEWCDRVLALPLGIVRAMHAEGGPEASLSIRSPTLNLDLNGSYETGFVESEDILSQQAIPNVLGVAVKPRRKP